MKERKRQGGRQTNESLLCLSTSLKKFIDHWLLVPRRSGEKLIFVKMESLLEKKSPCMEKMTFLLISSCAHKIRTMTNANIACELFYTPDSILGVSHIKRNQDLNADLRSSVIFVFI